jgi:outer membrane immunogenic protein
MLRLILLASAGAMALAGPALAAEPLPPPPPPAPPPPMWTGFYVGLNAGGTWSSSNSVNTSTSDLACSATLGGCPGAGVVSAGLGTTSVPINTGGFIGGGQWGYNYQFGTNSNWVAGFESDVQGIATGNHTTNRFSSAINPPFTTEPFDQNLTVSKSFGFLATDRVRLGFLITPTWLVYGTGGLAYGTTDVSTSIAQIVANDPALPNPYFSHGSFNHWLAGWTAGGGLEWLFAPNWSVKVEYLYYDLGSVSYALSPLVNVNSAGTVFTVGAPTASTRFNGNIVRAGIDYHINWLPAPVVAKY